MTVRISLGVIYAYFLEKYTGFCGDVIGGCKTHRNGARNLQPALDSRRMLSARRVPIDTALHGEVCASIEHTAAV